MGQFQSVQDPFGISRLVQQLNIERKDRAQQPIRDLQKQLLQGQVSQQQGQLSDLARKRQDMLDLRSEIEANPEQNPDLTTLNFLKKRDPQKAGEFVKNVWQRAGDLMKVAGGKAGIDYVNQRTGQNYEYLGKDGDFDKIDLGDKVILYDGVNDKIIREFPKAQKGQETIETMPDGSVRITRGGAPKKFTEVQTKSGGFADRVKSSNELLENLEDTKGFNPADISETIMGSVPGAGNLMISPEKQRYNQAKQNFITANLRLESGAAIGKDEFVKEDKKFFPQPGDSPSVIKQKREARKRQFDILRAASGGFYDEVQKQRAKRETSETGDIQQPTEGTVVIVNPETGERLTLKNGAWVKNGG